MLLLTPNTQHNMSFVFVSPWWSLADFGATIKTSPLSSIVGGFLRLRRGNLSPTSDECIRSRRFDRQRPVLLQGGGFDQARAVPKFSAVPSLQLWARNMVIHHLVPSPSLVHLSPLLLGTILLRDWPPSFVEWMDFCPLFTMTTLLAITFNGTLHDT